MPYKNIAHNLESPKDIQISHLQIAEALLDNLNSLAPSNFSNTALKYDGERFDATKFGFAHKFLIDDVKYAIKDNLEAHKEFILKTVHDEFIKYESGNKSDADYKNMEIFLTSILKYYGCHSGLSYPVYKGEESGTKFKSFLDSLNSSIDAELRK